ncbi:MAG: ATP-binding protein [Sulfurimonas sp.]
MIVDNFLIFIFIAVFVVVLIVFLFMRSNHKKDRLISDLKKENGDLRGALGVAKESTPKKSYDGMKTSLISEQLNKIEMLENEVERQKQKVEDAQEISKEAVKVKYEFLSNIRHEIRTPLNSIIAFATLLVENIDNPKLQSYAKKIFNSGNKLLSLIDSIIELSKIEAGKFDIQERAVDIDFFMRGIVSQYHSSALQKGLQFHLDIDHSLPESIIIDGDKVKFIIEDLISNAIKFTTKGYVNVYLKPNGKNVANNTVNLQIIVEDSGIGIKKDQQEKVFEMFENVVDDENRDSHSLGLGLTIDKKIAQMMQGDLTFYSEYAKGTTFILSLNDVEIVLPSAEENVDDEQIDFSLIRPEGASVMVIDTDDESRDMFRKSFLESHVKVDTYSNAREAIEALKQDSYDLIFIDIRILTGEDNAVSKVIAKISEASVVTLTSSSLKGVKFAKNGAKVVGHLKKPISKHQLFKTSMNVLNSTNVLELQQIHMQIHEDLFADLEPKEAEAFLEQHNEKLQKLFEGAKASNDLKDAKAFASALYAIASKLQIYYFTEFAKKLLRAIDIIDIDGIEEALSEYELVLNKLENL